MGVMELTWMPVVVPAVSGPWSRLVWTIDRVVAVVVMMVVRIVVALEIFVLL